MQRSLALAAVLLLALAGAACRGEPGLPEPPDLITEPPPDAASHIDGVITRVSPPSGFARTIRVEQVPEASVGFPLAEVKISEGTRIIRQTDRGLVRASVGELVVGTRVQVWFHEWTHELDYVQAEARFVLILP